jgi:hypothetical protein
MSDSTKYDLGGLSGSVESDRAPCAERLSDLSSRRPICPLADERSGSGDCGANPKTSRLSIERQPVLCSTLRLETRDEPVCKPWHGDPTFADPMRTRREGPQRVVMAPYGSNLLCGPYGKQGK